MKLLQQKKALTIVELIIVITILVVLGAISFIAFQSYAKDSRDTARLNDLKLMRSSLEMLKAEGGTYPMPSDPTPITYSGTVLWHQGTFGHSVRVAVKVMDKVPVDPLTGNEYTYSLLWDKSFYELGAVYESDLLK